MKAALFSVFIFFIACLLWACSADAPADHHQVPTEGMTVELKNLSDAQYPDNPDIGFRSQNYSLNLFETCKIDASHQAFRWDFTFLTKASDSITLKQVDVSEFIPTIPKHIQSDEYLSYIACINQEWNRNQVQFNADEFSSSIADVVRVDLARNCLNAYLWEIIVYVEEAGRVLPYAHGWFDFPQEAYAQLFEQKNKLPYTKYQVALENWVDPQNELVDLSLLRKPVDTIRVRFKDLSDAMYPLKAARQKKYKEIIYPDTFSTMRDLQSDASLFATFSPPGFYNKKDPRTTELGRIYNLKQVDIYQVKAATIDTPLYELQLTFLDKKAARKTTLVIGGINPDDFPVLSEEKANQGWKNSMGIGNHSFYESYQNHLSNKSETSPYYALLLDEKGQWLDSHKIGIDGPIFHFSDANRTELHLWLLSFERHALVGHYCIKLP